MKFRHTLSLVCLIIALQAVAFSTLQAQNSALKLALLKYSGGGDWYSNPTSLPNLAEYCKQYLDIDFDIDYATVELGGSDIYNYPFVHMTGHGNVVFSASDAENMRNYLLGGGFLHIDDNYGMDPYIRVAMKEVFPELEFIELPFDHPIYSSKYQFKNGLPKIHKHDGKAPQGFALIWEGRIVCFYTYECDLGDGWEDPSVHKDSPELRQKALQMGANIVKYAFEQ